MHVGPWPPSRPVHASPETQIRREEVKSDGPRTDPVVCRVVMVWGPPSGRPLNLNLDRHDGPYPAAKPTASSALSLLPTDSKQARWRPASLALADGRRHERANSAPALAAVAATDSGVKHEGPGCVSCPGGAGSQPSATDFETRGLLPYHPHHCRGTRRLTRFDQSPPLPSPSAPV